MPTAARPPRSAYLALIALCIVWGTVYLGIRIALESFPPMLFMGGRFLFAGAIILLSGALFGARMPSRAEFLTTSLHGVITLGIGIGTLAFSLQWIPSGLAAMLSTTTPFWMVALEALLPSRRAAREKPSVLTVLGLVVGLAGTLVLVAPGTQEQGLGGATFLAFIVLQIGCGGFAFGSILERRHVATTHPIINSGVQELATGIVFLIPALFLNQPVHWSWKGVLAVLYVTAFGGVIGYSSYLYALKHLPVSLVSIYTYVNPAVAVLVGSLFYGEKIRPADLLGMAIILGGVFLVKKFSGRGATTGVANSGNASPHVP